MSRRVMGAALWLAALAGLVACGDAGPMAATTAASPSAPVRASPTPPATHTSPTPMPVPHPAVSADWVGPFYAPHAHGYDLSYPQCPGRPPPASAAFAIVGVNGGKGFTINPCALAEWQAARGTRAVYFNSGYDPANAGRATSDCVTRSRLQDGGPQRRGAYAIGCSEAVYAESTMHAIGASRAAMIWLDVESANTWDPSNLDLNHVALQAEIDQLAAFGHVVGLYATFAEWRGLMGQWSPAGVVADWVAGQSALTACGAPGFSGQPVWMAQELGTWSDGLDSDWTC